MRRRPCRQSLINSRKQFRAVPPGEIECTGSNQVFQDLPVDRPGIQTAAVILKRFEWTVLLSLDDRRLHRAFTDVFDRSKAIPNSTLPFPSFGHKLQMAQVYIGREYRYAEPFALSDKHSNLLRVVDFITEQSSHEFDRIVCLQVCSSIAN